MGQILDQELYYTDRASPTYKAFFPDLSPNFGVCYNPRRGAVQVVHRQTGVYSGNFYFIYPAMKYAELLEGLMSEVKLTRDKFENIVRIGPQLDAKKSAALQWAHALDDEMMERQSRFSYGDN